MLDDPSSPRIISGLAKLGLVLKSHAWQRAGRRGLTPTQSQILALLAAHPEEALTLSALAKALAVTPATASDAVAALWKKRLVRKVSARQDRRLVRISLTARGRQEALRASEWPDFLVAAVDALSASEQAGLLLALTRMIRSLQEQGKIPIARMCVNCTYFVPNRYDDPERPHHCAFVGAAFGPRQFRLECPDFAAAAPEAQRSNVLALFPNP